MRKGSYKIKLVGIGRKYLMIMISNFNIGEVREDVLKLNNLIHKEIIKRNKMTN